MPGRLGLLSIGQAPAPGSGTAPAIARFLSPDVQTVWAGALDGLAAEQVAQLAPGPDDYTLITRLRDKTPVTIAKRHLLPLLQERIHHLEQAEGVDGTLILCTGEFPPFAHQRLLFEPERLVMGIVSGLLTRQMRLGVLIPLPEQVGWAAEKWRPLCAGVEVVPASPYEGERGVDSPAQAARALRSADLVVMDCMGYTDEQKEAVQAETGKPVVLSVTAVAHVLGELFAKRGIA